MRYLTKINIWKSEIYVLKRYLIEDMCMKLKEKTRTFLSYEITIPLVTMHVHIYLNPNK